MMELSEFETTCLTMILNGVPLHQKYLAHGFGLYKRYINIKPLIYLTSPERKI
jgi:hypothetical protein